MRQFAIIGLGRFGFYLAKALSEAGFEVLAIDVDEQRVDAIKGFVSKAVIADVTDKEALASVGVKDMDVVVALAGEMAASVLATLNLKELGVQSLMVRASSDQHRRILELIGASKVIFPEQDTAQRIAYNLSMHDVLEHLPVAEGYSIIQVPPPQSFVGKTLDDLKLIKKYGILVVAVKEAVPENLILSPGPQFRIKDSDVLVVMGKDEDLTKLRDIK